MYLPPEIWEKIWRYHKRIIFEHTRQYLERGLRLPILGQQIIKDDVNGYIKTGLWSYEIRGGPLLIWLKFVENDDGEAVLKWSQIFRRYNGFEDYEYYGGYW